MNNDSRIILITVKYLRATETKGSRMKVWHGDKTQAARTYGYHDVNGFEDAAQRFIAEEYGIHNVGRSNWVNTHGPFYTVALVY
jgi:hypothetical protein